MNLSRTKITRLYAAQLRESAYAQKDKTSYSRGHFSLPSAISFALFIFGAELAAAILFVILK